MGEGASRAFAEWQRETTLPESGSYSMGWARVKPALRVLSVLSLKPHEFGLVIKIWDSASNLFKSTAGKNFALFHVNHLICISHC